MCEPWHLSPLSLFEHLCLFVGSMECFQECGQDTGDSQEQEQEQPGGEAGE